MPRRASEPAIGFTAIARELDSTKVPAESDEWKGLVTMCKRCSEAVVSEYGWKDFNVASALDEYVYGPCGSAESGKMDSLLFATSFAAALQKAQMDFKSLNSGSSRVKEQVDDLQKDNDDLLSLKKRLKHDVDKHRRELDYTKEELLMMKQELKNLKKKHRMSLNELS
jgi:peptidoglycan hydrolase CwlO-like protein